MSKHTLFISDLHLQASQPEITHIFQNFTENQARKAEAIYILGDLFEAWLGDDDNTEFNYYIKSLLKSLTLTGIPVYIMPGNRDFLLGQNFLEQTGCTIIPDPLKIQLYGKTVLLKHGDDLCTNDIKHIQFRNKTRNKYIQKLFLFLPLFIRHWLAKKIRKISTESNYNKPMDIMDVNSQAVEQAMEKAQVNQLIHGHTHRPAVHNIQINNQLAERIVLAAWHEQGNALIYWDSGEHELIYFS